MASKFDSNLLLDRVEFKIFAAEKHLTNLIEFELNFPNIEKNDVAIQMELEIDCFLVQLLGFSRLSVDANQHKIRIGNRFRKGRHSNNTKRLERQNKEY